MSKQVFCRAHSSPDSDGGREGGRSVRAKVGCVSLFFYSSCFLWTRVFFSSVGNEGRNEEKMDMDDGRDYVLKNASYVSFPSLAAFWVTVRSSCRIVDKGKRRLINDGIDTGEYNDLHNNSV